MRWLTIIVNIEALASNLSNRITRLTITRQTVSLARGIHEIIERPNTAIAMSEVRHYMLFDFYNRFWRSV